MRELREIVADIVRGQMALSAAYNEYMESRLSEESWREMMARATHRRDAHNGHWDHEGANEDMKRYGDTRKAKYAKVEKAEAKLNEFLEELMQAVPA